MSNDLSAELRTYLYDALSAHSVEFQRDAHWVMSAEWFDECRRMTDSDGRPLWEPSMQRLYPEGPLLLFGILIEVRADGGAPHLEAFRPASRPDGEPCAGDPGGGEGEQDERDEQARGQHEGNLT
jgi:hypothetical protein